MNVKRFGLSVALAVLLSSMLASFVAAHPLGNFSVNRYSRLTLTRDEATLRYVLDLAEIPTLQELRNTGVQGSPNAAEQQAFMQRKASELARGARLAVGGQPVSWSLAESTISVVPGQADLDTLRISLLLSASVSVQDGARLEYHDTNYAGRAGWHEIVLRNGDGIGLSGSTASTVDRSDELRSCPEQAEQAPLDVSSATATARWDASAGHVEDTTTGEERLSSTRRLGLDPRAEQLSALLRTAGAASPSATALALLVAAALGALHALEPGHGKTIVGGYLVGSRGTARHALFLGLTVTITHTIGVYALGLVTLVAAEHIVPERLYPILGVVSGILVALIGLSLLRTRLRPIWSAAMQRIASSERNVELRPLDLAAAAVGTSPQISYATAYFNGWDAGEAYQASHLDGHGDGPHRHLDTHGLFLRGIPRSSSGALELADVHAHAHAHDHSNGHGHSHAHPLDHNHRHDDDYGFDRHDLLGEDRIGLHHHRHSHDVLAAHDHDNAGVPHSHGWGRSHTHSVHGSADAPITARGLLALGVSGGLLPCPAALVVLLAAVSFHNLGLGMVLVAAFSLGLATVLTALGLLILYGSRILGRSPLAGKMGGTPLARALPALSAAVVMVAGVVIAAQAASALV